ncbi:MAG TPA: ATP-binding protein [Verrucomicrobiae bacterium]|nr:ATP-binding protein [Verrucomicrobiae bacterium]
MIINSIRWRLQAWHSLILVLVLAGFGLTAYRVARGNQLRRVDQELQQRLMAAFRFGPPPGPGMAKGPPPEESHHDRPPPDRFPKEHGREHDPAAWRAHMQEVIANAVALEAGQTNSFYYILWQANGTVLASSPGAPQNVPLPEEPSANRESAERPGTAARTRGELRELGVCLPFGDKAVVGRSMAPDLAAMHRLALWLFAAGAAVLSLGMAGGWWVATRAIRPIEDISATAVKIAGGDLSQRINASDTESELGRLAGVLNSTFARLEAAFANQVRFTADASHELRTPVSVILSQTQTALSRERGAAEYRETLEACQRAAQRMRKLIESLLALARLDAGQEPMKQECFDLARVVRDCVELVRPLAAERSLELRCDLPQVQCTGDPERLGQVVTNLLSNAIHFNRDRGEVRVTARSDNGTAILSVTDTGTGIPPEDLPHIFERFYRVDKARSRIQGKTGLGLAICKAIVEAHSGTIQVSSQLGVGSTFEVRLPTDKG